MLQSENRTHGVSPTLRQSEFLMKKKHCASPIFCRTSAVLFTNFINDAPVQIWKTLRQSKFGKHCVSPTCRTGAVFSKFGLAPCFCFVLFCFLFCFVLFCFCFVFLFFVSFFSLFMFYCVLFCSVLFFFFVLFCFVLFVLFYIWFVSVFVFCFSFLFVCVCVCFCIRVQSRLEK